MSGPSYHARTHIPGGTDPLDLATLGSAIVQLGGKMPWFQSTYSITGGTALTSGDVHVADQFGGTAATVRTTDNAAGYTDVLSAPQVYTDGTFFACDYSTTPEVSVKVLQAGVYYVSAEFIINHSDITAGSPLFASVGVRVQTVAGGTNTSVFSDSREISDALLTDGLDDGTPADYDGEMAHGRIVAARPVYIGEASNIQVAYLHEGTLIGGGIVLSVFRISDGGGNSAPGSGSGAGIVYDFANTGDWLQIETTTGDPNLISTGTNTYADHGVSIVTRNQHDLVLGADDGGNVHVEASSVYLQGLLFLDGNSGDNATFNFDAGYTMHGGPFLFDGQGFEVDSSDGVFLDSSGGTAKVQISVDGNDMELISRSHKIKFIVGAFPGTVAMEIHHDGSIHIPTGTSIIADL